MRAVGMFGFGFTVAGMPSDVSSQSMFVDEDAVVLLLPPLPEATLTRSTRADCDPLPAIASTTVCSALSNLKGKWNAEYTILTIAFRIAVVVVVGGGDDGDGDCGCDVAVSAVVGEEVAITL